MWWITLIYKSLFSISIFPPFPRLFGHDFRKTRQDTTGISSHFPKILPRKVIGNDGKGDTEQALRYRNMCMRRYSILSIGTAVLACVIPFATHAATYAPDALLGKILIDTGRHGEAWYVNPQSRMKVALGRPEEALTRLRDRAIYIGFVNIARLAERDGEKTDAAYAKKVAGFVLAPNDVIGAAWYVDPATGLRRRLATPDDAWQIMRVGSPVSSKVLDAIPSEAASPLVFSVATVKKAVAGNMLELNDGRKVALISVDVPANPDLQQAAMSKLDALTAGKTVLLEKDGKDKDDQGRTWRFVHAGEANLSYELVRNGLAFHEIDFPNYKYAEMLIVGSLDAARLKRGFWNH